MYEKHDVCNAKYHMIMYGMLLEHDYVLKCSMKQNDMLA